MAQYTAQNVKAKAFNKKEVAKNLLDEFDAELIPESITQATKKKSDPKQREEQ